MDDYFIFSVFCSSYTKKPLVPLYVLEVSSPETVNSKDTSGPVTMGHFSHWSPVKLPSASKTDNFWGPLVSPEIQVGSEPLYPNSTSVHYVAASTKALCTSLGLICQAIKSSTSSHPSPPPGRRKGPSILFPGWNIHCLTLTVPDQKSPRQDQERQCQFFCVWGGADCCLVSAETTLTALWDGPFSLLSQLSSFSAFFSLSSRTRASSLKVGSPSHFLMSSP